MELIFNFLVDFFPYVVLLDVSDIPSFVVVVPSFQHLHEYLQELGDKTKDEERSDLIEEFAIAVEIHVSAVFFCILNCGPFLDHSSQNF
jgi:hypothetical protein